MSIKKNKERKSKPKIQFLSIKLQNIACLCKLMPIMVTF